MADETTTTGIAALVAAIVVGLEKGVGAMIRFWKKSKDEKDDKDAEAKRDGAERLQWGRINKLAAEQAKHEKEDAAIHAEFRTKIDQVQRDVAETKADVKTLLRRSTGRHKE